MYAVFEAAGREPAHVGKHCLEIAREPLDGTGTLSARFLLQVEDVPSDLPVQCDQLTVCAGHGAPT